ncbi:MAG: MYXO-CTERM sorting domain-containing protein [Myxococcota bacterium]
MKIPRLLHRPFALRSTTAGWALACAALTLATSARAQTTDPVVNDGVEESGLGLLVDAPLGSDGGRINCESVEQDSCAPLNLESCPGEGGESRPLDLQLTSQGNVPVDSRLLVFLTDDSDCVFSEPDELDGRPVESIQLNDSGDPLVTNEAFNFPLDFDDDGGAYSNVEELLEASGACDEDNPVNEGQFRLCFVASETDDIAESGEPFAALLMLIDTQPPGAATRLDLRPLDGRVEFDVDSDDDDLRAWNFRFRPAEDDGASCDAWPTSTTREFDLVNQGEQTFETDLDNGITYEVCVFAEDEAGNPGEFSDVSLVTPRDECDFIECFPGTIEDGYCGSAPGTGLWAVLAVLGLLSRRRSGAAR